MPDSREHRLILESRFEEVARAEQAVLQHIAEQGFDQTAQFAVKLSLEEALTNAIKHGNRFDPDKQVTLTFDIDADRLRMTVCDEGGGFSPHAVPDPTLDENLEKPHGRGIMLIRAYMTEVSFSPCGKCLTMIKKRHCRLPETS